jgi:hypothetical protein
MEKIEGPIVKRFGIMGSLVRGLCVSFDSGTEGDHSRFVPAVPVPAGEFTKAEGTPVM